ncbi:unnamed protein product [Lepeophtheirus salmonis]|uniref:(salmon louse) hypothetical protein n=1 Tax=Lepeophtheirus salmonis TaxID=72036 RepID=A0A7R8CGU7_LEPSM|nr:unnamed protein product [Lepeophtheirus salmonis]CAF2814888.1 unnamed protein product [Lepeophtheirus salmonis]
MLKYGKYTATARAAVVADLKARVFRQQVFFTKATTCQVLAITESFEESLELTKPKKPLSDGERSTVHRKRRIPKGKEGLLKSARVLIDDKDYKEALKIIKNVLDIDPVNYNGLVFCGLCLHHLNKNEKGVQAFQKAIRTDDKKNISLSGAFFPI